MVPFEHTKLSVRDFGGELSDYIDIHDFLDSTKGYFPSWQHRAILHNGFGMILCEKIFGSVIKNSDGKEIPVREIARRHIMQDCNGKVPTIQDWLKDLPLNESWMNKPLLKDIQYLRKQNQKS